MTRRVSDSEISEHVEAEQHRRLDARRDDPGWRLVEDGWSDVLGDGTWVQVQEDSTVKTCSACRQELPRSAFNRSTARNDGLQGKCRDCANVANKIYRASNPEKIRARQSAYHRRYYAENRETVKAKVYAYQRSTPDLQRERRAAYYAENREQVKARQAAYLAAHPEEVRLAGLARDTVHRAVKSGRLIRASICEECGAAGRIEAAHHDYSRRLDVRWLCQPCHRRWDRRQPKLFGKPATQADQEESR